MKSIIERPYSRSDWSYNHDSQRPEYCNMSHMMFCLPSKGVFLEVYISLCSDMYWLPSDCTVNNHCSKFQSSWCKHRKYKTANSLLLNLTAFPLDKGHSLTRAGALDCHSGHRYLFAFQLWYSYFWCSLCHWGQVAPSFCASTSAVSWAGSFTYCSHTASSESCLESQCHKRVLTMMSQNFDS